MVISWIDITVVPAPTVMMQTVMGLVGFVTARVDDRKTEVEGAATIEVGMALRSCRPYFLRGFSERGGTLGVMRALGLRSLKLLVSYRTSRRRVLRGGRRI